MIRFRPLSLAACLLAGAALSGCTKQQAPPPQPAQTSVQPAPAPAAVPPGGTAAAPAPATVPEPAPAVPAAAAPATAAAPAPASTAPAMSSAPAMAATPKPRPTGLTIPAGTRVSIRTNETISAEHSDPGAGFTGTLNSPIVVRGVTAFPRGTEVRGEISSAKARGRFKGAGDLGVRLTSIGGYRVSTSEYVTAAKGRGKRTAGFIGGGGGAGALIGGLAGGGKGALIGALTGAGAGTAATAFTGSRDVKIPAESVISFTTRSSISKK